MLSKYTTMVMTAVRLSWLHVWNDVVLAMDEQNVRLYWCVLEFEASCYWCSMQYEVVMPPSCAVSIHYNGDDGCAFVLVECMERCRVDPERTVGTFVLVCA